MKIDEPETPWASPPKELYADEDGDVTLPQDNSAQVMQAEVKIIPIIRLPL